MALETLGQVEKRQPDPKGSYSKLIPRPDLPSDHAFPMVMLNVTRQLGAGAPADEGETLHNPDYGRTLLQLAERGTDDFYHGDLARRMSDDLAANGSFVTAEDLARYQVRNGESVVGTYRGFTIATAPPPHGGPTLLTILNILEGYGLAALGHNSPDYVFLVSMAMKAAFADRNPYMGDPEFAHLPLEWMISKDRAAEWRRHIDAGKPIQVAFASPEPADTTHVSIVDEHGNCVALTHSLGMSSGVITPGLGFMYNDSMVNFHPLPAHANSIAPRKGRTTGMTPTIVYGRTLGQGRGDPQQRTSIGWRHGGDHEGVQAALGSGFGFPGLRQGAERVRSTSQAA